LGDGEALLDPDEAAEPDHPADPHLGRLGHHVPELRETLDGARPGGRGGGPEAQLGGDAPDPGGVEGIRDEDDVADSPLRDQEPGRGGQRLPRRPAQRTGRRATRPGQRVTYRSSESLRRRNTSACSISRSPRGAASRPRSAAKTPRSRSSARRLRGTSGQRPPPSVK